MGISRTIYGFCFLALFCAALDAKPSKTLLQLRRDADPALADPKWEVIGQAYGNAVFFSNMKLPSTSKLPGPWRIRTELGGAVFDVDDRNLVLVSEEDADGNRRASDGYESIFAKVGMSFPFGFQTDIGLTQTMSDLKTTSIHGHAVFQAFDFAEIIYTDMIPSLAISASYLHVMTGAAVSGLTGQILIGSYHRYWLAQVNYIFQASYIMIKDVSPSYSYMNFRHGLSSTWPLYEGVTLTANLYYRPLEASVSLGYQF